MIIPLLQPDRSIDDFVDKDEGTRLGALLADSGTVGPEEELYLKEVCILVRQAMRALDDRERHIIRNRFGLPGGRSSSTDPRQGIAQNAAPIEK